MVIHYTEYIFLRELMEKLKIPSNVDLMKIAIADLKDLLFSVGSPACIAGTFSSC